MIKSHVGFTTTDIYIAFHLRTPFRRTSFTTTWPPLLRKSGTCGRARTTKFMVVGARLPENKQLDGEVEEEDRVPEVAEGEAAAAADGDGEMYRIPEKVKEEEADTSAAAEEAQAVAGRAKAVTTALVVRRIWSFTASKNSTSVRRTAAG